MPAQPTDLTPWARTGLIVLCLLLATSVAGRVYAYRQPPEGGTVDGEASAAPMDFGAGVQLPRAATQSLTVSVDRCASPVSIAVFRAGPYGSDPSLMGAPRPGDRIYYVYRGWKLGERFASVGLNAIYFAHRAVARLTMRTNPAWDDLALKIIVPAGCGASPDDVQAVLRGAAHFQNGPTP